MEFLWGALKLAAFTTIMVLVFIGGPVWGATGSLEHAWYAVKSYCKIMGTLVAVGVGLGLMFALTG